MANENEKKESLKEEQNEEESQESRESEKEECKDEDLEQRVKSLEESLKEQEDKYLRTYADFENSKKRLEREKYQAIEYSQEQFAKDLLPAIDSLELAVNSALAIEEVNKESFENLKKGIELTLEQLYKAFSKHYVETIPTEEGFDPHSHNAVMQVESEEHNEGDIVQVMQKGYKLRDRILRPSMVSICKK